MQTPSGFLLYGHSEQTISESIYIVKLPPYSTKSSLMFPSKMRIHLEKCCLAPTYWHIVVNILSKCMETLDLITSIKGSMLSAGFKFTADLEHNLSAVLQFLLPIGTSSLPFHALSY